MKHGHHFLAVKSASLAAEARIIRRRERAARRELRGELRRHRIHVVKTEARATHIARALMRGRSYDQIEPTVLNKFHAWPRVVAMVQRYSATPLTEAIQIAIARADELVAANQENVHGRAVRRKALSAEKRAPVVDPVPEGVAG